MSTIYNEAEYENSVIELFQGMGYEHVYGPDIERQLIDYPVHLITRTVKQMLKAGLPIRQTVNNVRKGLKESRMLRYIPLTRMRKSPKLLFILLLKLHLYAPAVLLCAIKIHRQRAGCL